jgi:hypothetical protein
MGTRSEAWVVSNNPVCMIEGKSGGCSLDHMIVVRENELERPVPLEV